jgi:GNAT superfamily N-acetyltransferase
MKSDFGVQVTGNDDPPFVMMAFTPAYYEQLLLACGLQAIRQFHAYLYDYETSYEKVMADEQRLIDASRRILKRYPQLSIRDVQRSHMEQTLKEINVLGNRVRSAGWGFVPLTDEELDFMIKQLKQVLRPDMLLVAYWEDKLVGYCVNVPDINSALRRTIGNSDWIRLPQFLYWLPRVKRTRVIALGADEAYRRKGVGILLSTEMKTRGLRSAFRQWEFSWIDSKNEASIRNTHRIAEISQYKTYRLYEKPLSAS